MDIKNLAQQEYFVRENWDSLALFAYQNFVSKGRGALAIDLSSFVASGDEGKLNIRYLTADLPAFSRIKELGEMARTYNPETQIIFIFLQDPKAESIGGITCIGPKEGQSTPKQLYDNYLSSKRM